MQGRTAKMQPGADLAIRVGGVHIKHCSTPLFDACTALYMQEGILVELDGVIVGLYCSLLAS